MVWNADKPAVGNQISADIPDIEENFQELHDVITAITNGTLGTTTATDFKVDTISSPACWLQRARFVWKDVDEIYIYAGAYHHAGTKTQVVYWNSALTSDIGAPDASDWYYLYLDDSAIVTAGTDLLTATEFVWSNTEPTWSDAKHGWYNGNDRCIFAVYTDGSSNITEFYHDGGDYVRFANTVTLTVGTIGTAFTDVTVLAPKFSTKASVTFYGSYVDGLAYVTYRTNGQTGSVGEYVLAISADGTRAYNEVGVVTDASQIIEMKEHAATGNSYNAYSNGWYFPAGV